MSGESSDLSVDPETVAALTRGLTAAQDELREIGSATDALQGAGFENLAMSGMEAGGGALAEVFEDFCERWEWGVRALIQDANALAERLNLAAGMVHAEDEYWSTTWKIAANAISPTGNPHLTEEEIAQQDYGQLLAPKTPDYDMDWMQVGEDIKNTWTGPQATEGPGTPEGDR
ncbi:hypothetical protein JJV70_06020 [Streptomyces sp. JJ66]|uniref:hypothetical protein n=1 Tax=Streptomyces sp. JJ66 TaxID=2803843 RepID=UPI001C56F7A3|nr:hypothetical protein [Streptomyces sp. JJ66]MBW1601674.1 hypothetical protein [Streptomyces sp. JJ66]